MPTGTVTNLLTNSQSDGGDTSNPELLTLNQQTGGDALGNTTGFSLIRSATITYLTTQHHSGVGSIQVITPGVQSAEGVIQNGALTLSASTSYIFGVWVYAPNGANLQAQITNNTNDAGTTSFTGTGTWQYVEVVHTTTTTPLTYEFFIYTNGTQAITFYVDDCRLATTVTTGFTVSNGATLSVSPYNPYQGLRSLKVVTPGNAVNEGVILSNATVTSGKQNTGHIAINAPNGAGLILRLYDGSTSTDQAITGNGAWQVVEVTKTPASTTLSLRVLTSSQQGITFYVDTLMIGVIT
jgi:hypothetical protein